MLNALIAHTFSIPFPEDLEEEKWWFKAEQFMLLNNNDFLPTKMQLKNGNKGT